MELSDSKIKKISYIFSKESFSYNSGNRTLHFSAQARKKYPLQENFLYSSIKRFLIFSQEKAFLIFQEIELSIPQV